MCHIIVYICLTLTIFIPNSEILDIASLLHKGVYCYIASLKWIHPRKKYRKMEATPAAATKNSGTVHFSSPWCIRTVSIYFTSFAQSSQKPGRTWTWGKKTTTIYPDSVTSFCRTKDKLELLKYRKKCLLVLKSWYQFLTFP